VVESACMIKRASREQPDGRGLRVALVCSAFNAQVVDGLRRGAQDELRRIGVAAADIEHFGVPGAFELPLAVDALAASGRFQALVALGAVIQGETDHYEHVARACTDGLMGVMLERKLPVGFGVLTVQAARQALRRSAAGPDNKGAEAARAAVSLARLLERVATHRRRPTAQASRTARGRRARG
jgi:6,7-dimethyl-8-ribityllumazine synthase